MELLPANEMGRVLPLVPPSREAGHMAFVHSVLEGSMPGFIVVDNVDHPRSALACNLSDFWFALGEANATLVMSAMPLLAQRCPDRTGTALWTTTPDWEAALLPLFAASARRREFHFEPPSAVTPVPALEGFDLVALDAAVASRFGEDGREGVDPWVVGIWGGPAEFARRSFGFALLKDGAVAGFCAACAIAERGDREAEIEIGTAPRFKQLGVATIAGSAFLAECASRAYRPAWTCAEGNIASTRLAGRLGFKQFRTVTGFPIGRQMTWSAGKWAHPSVTN